MSAADPRDDRDPSSGAPGLCPEPHPELSAADDLVQEAIVKAWSNIDKFAVGTNLRAWLFTILRNTFFSERRKRKREVADSDGKFAATLAEKPGHDAPVGFQRLPRRL